MTNLDRLYLKIAQQTGLSKYRVEAIFKSQFEVTKQTMAKMEDKTIRHPFFGVFRVKPGRRKYLDSLKNYNNEQQQD